MTVITPRVCPVCGYQDNTGHGHIIAVAEDISNTRITARCDCPACKSVWKETVDRFLPEINIVISDGLKRKKVG